MCWIAAALLLVGACCGAGWQHPWLIGAASMTDSRLCRWGTGSVPSWVPGHMGGFKALLQLVTRLCAAEALHPSRCWSICVRCLYMASTPHFLCVFAPISTCRRCWTASPAVQESSRRPAAASLCCSSCPSGSPARDRTLSAHWLGSQPAQQLLQRL